MHLHRCALLLLVLLTASADAQQARRSPEDAFKYLDTDGHGRLSETEFAVLKDAVPYLREHPEAVAAVFKKLDANGDGGLAFEEYREFYKMGQRPQTGTPTPPPNPETAKPEPAKPSAALSAPPTADGIAFFEKNIRPVLVDKCYKCHAADSEKIKGGLVLDTREGIRKGGDTGPAIVPGDLAKSLLIEAIRHTNKDTQMPPEKKGGKLPDSVIANFEQWVRIGAPDPRDGKAAVVQSSWDTEKARAHWAYQPVKNQPAPKVSDAGWAKNDIDRFLLAALEAKGLKPIGDADKAALLRRVYFDLTGLPPTPEELQSFLNDRTPDALSKVVDALLKSPRFGERWGRQWLDVARFAESTGRDVNATMPNAWRYRDYVIAAFNADKPYDQFIREQIAGDLLPAKDSRERAQNLIATGFLALGSLNLNERNPRQFALDIADEQSTPGTETRYGTAPTFENGHPGKEIALPADAGVPRGPKKLTAEERARIERDYAVARKFTDQLYASLYGGGRKGPEGGLNNDPKKLVQAVGITARVGQLQRELDAYDSDGNPKPMAIGVLDLSAKAAARPRSLPMNFEEAFEIFRGRPADLSAIQRSSGFRPLNTQLSTLNSPSSGGTARAGLKRRRFAMRCSR